MKPLIVWSCTLMALCGTSLAQENNTTGIGIAFGVGPSTIEDEDGPGDTFNGRGFGWNFDFEWRLIENLAIGFNVTDFGDDTDFFNGQETRLEVDGFGFYLRGYLPVSPTLTLFARYGETSYNVDADPGVGTTFPFNDSAKDFGVGGDYYFNENLSLRLETRLLDGPSQESGSLTTIGLRWQF